MKYKYLAILFLLITPALAFAQSTIEEAFSPRQGATELVIKTISEARQSIRMAAYSFTSRPIARALLDACTHGVQVQAVFDKSQRNNNLVHAFDGSCVKTRINDYYAIMHDKSIIVDDKTLETGSFNYTQAAENRNAENVLVIHNEPQIIAGYIQQWQKLWDESRAE